MNETAVNAVAAWVTKAGLVGSGESQFVAGFRSRSVGAGIPPARAMIILDTLHPI